MPQGSSLPARILTNFVILTVQSLLIIHLYTNKIALNFILLKQHIKIVVLFKSLNNSSTCFGQFLTILREIFIFFTSVTKDKLFRLGCTTTTSLGMVGRINTKDNEYNRHATANLKSLYLVTDVKKINISLRMVKN